MGWLHTFVSVKESVEAVTRLLVCLLVYTGTRCSSHRCRVREEGASGSLDTVSIRLEQTMSILRCGICDGPKLADYRLLFRIGGLCRAEERQLLVSPAWMHGGERERGTVTYHVGSSPEQEKQDKCCDE